MGKWLKSFPISIVYASPLLRARRTAEIVCAELGLTPIYTNLLVEVDVGELEGKSEADPKSKAAFGHVEKLWEEGSQHKGFPGGETLLDTEDRIRKLLSKVDNSDSTHILLVGHCLLFMALIWLFCENHGPALESGHMGRARLSILRKMSDKLRLEKFDLTPQDKL
jgi:broad specificity phosphatase PhoE